jgi:hypothetical protein
LVDALIENIEKSLGRQPVKIDADGIPTYTYRGEVANNGIKMAGSECGMFKDKAEVTHRMNFDDLSDEAAPGRDRGAVAGKASGWAAG